MKDKLEKLTELLLDTGKRNNLINFRDNKSNTLEVVSPDFDTLFKKASASVNFEVFDPQLDADDDEDRLSDSKLKEILRNRKGYIEQYSQKIKKASQILVYNSSVTPMKALKNIEKRSKIAIEENGVNIAYMTFGFISWLDEQDAQTMYRAPILLAPISLSQKSGVDPYRISVVGGDMILNPTFAYKLQSEYKLELPEYDDEEDIESYLGKIEELVGKLKWGVERSCKIGLFSFLKINMYRDLKDNADIILKNDNIRKMFGGEVDTPSDNGEEVRQDFEPRFNVVDADSSQLKAIELAKAGESFVLQGPPGTGKSQTITNIIAECLADGKKVLFVSEKLAALDVVYNKLKQAGLEDFCLQLHSHKANKRDFIQELCRTMRLEKSGVSSKAAEEEDRLNKSHIILDNYAEVLHACDKDIEKSLYQLVEEVCACKNSVELDYFLEDIESKNNEFLAAAVELLEQYAEYEPYIGYDYRQAAWYGYLNKDTSSQQKFNAKRSLVEMIDVCSAAKEAGRQINASLNIVSLTDFTKLDAYARLFELLSVSRFIAAALFDKSVFKRVADKIIKLRPLADEISTLAQTLTQTFDDGIFKLDAKTCKQTLKQYDGAFSRLFSKEYKSAFAQLKGLSKTGKLNHKGALAILDTLEEYQSKRASFEELQIDVKDNLSQDYCGVESDWDALDKELGMLKPLFASIDDFGRLKDLSAEEFDCMRDDFASFSTKCASICERLERQAQFVADFDKEAFDIFSLPFDIINDKFKKCLSRMESLDNWKRFVVVYEGLKERDMLKFVNAAMEKDVPVSDFVGVFKKIFYTQWIDFILQQNEFLQAFPRVAHDKTVGIFCDKDVRNFEISKAKIRSLLSAGRPELSLVAPGSSVANLLNEGGKKRRQKAIRTLLLEIRELAQSLKPCFLMSPLSVSTYLTSEIKFDVVIFDEASQIFPQDAIGAIYRGKQIIVVGDSKQMPPSNFFMAVAEADELDDESDDVKDFESVLDLCATILPQLRLKWHYRSRYEQLIDFSNKNFYENDLVTFPSARIDAEGIGVDFHYVDKGVFDHKSRANRAEAEYIVDLVFENIKKYPDRSLGVVAFSISQQDLIERLLAKRRLSDASQEEFFSSDKTEPFFVKNLETVQGDERDTIIFSMAYARDKSGKMSQNFGPINKAGGERRLNVAVTRAKHNVQFVASVHHFDIDLKNSNSVGAKMLRDYLYFAESGGAVFSEKSMRAEESSEAFEFEMEVAEFLRSKGYEVDPKVGSSAQSVDLGVKMPNGEDYILAVECDGRSYKAAKNTRDRERLRQSVLQRMGWHYHRIWALDWIKNKKDEKERLLQAVADAVKAPLGSVSADNIDVIIDDYEVKKECEACQFAVYTAANFEKAKAIAGADYLRYVRNILEYEAPLSEELFLKRSIRDFSREKVTDAVWDQFDRWMSRCGAEGIARKDGFMYIRNRPVHFRIPGGEFVREIKNISLEELADGILTLVQKNISVDRMGLYKLLAKLSGFSKLGENMVKRFDLALELIKDEIDVEGEELSIKG